MPSKTASYNVYCLSKGKLQRKLCYHKDDRAMRAIQVDRMSRCGDMAIRVSWGIWNPIWGEGEVIFGYHRSNSFTKVPLETGLP